MVLHTTNHHQILLKPLHNPAAITMKFHGHPNLALLLLFSIILSSVLPVPVRGDCTCDSEEEERDKTAALKYKIIALISILFAGAIGITIPIIGKKIPSLKPGNNFFYIIKSFAGGVILGTGVVHIAPDGFESLTSPCLPEKPWGDYPFTGLVIGVSTMITMLIDVFATSYFNRSRSNQNVNDDMKIQDEEDKGGDVHSNSTHGHGHAHGVLDTGRVEEGSNNWFDLVRHRVVAQVLELGILVHSVIIGIDIGVSQSPSTIKPLVAAITFHQMFEGMGLGGCIAQAKLKTRSTVVMVLFFALTTPAGILIGMGISKTYDETSPTALIVEGLLNAAAAGILLYMALVDVLSADFMNPDLQNNLKLTSCVSVSMFLGFGCMALLAIWA